jgi:hypothetical protein
MKTRPTAGTLRMYSLSTFLEPSHSRQMRWKTVRRPSMLGFAARNVLFVSVEQMQAVLAVSAYSARVEQEVGNTRSTSQNWGVIYKSLSLL